MKNRMKSVTLFLALRYLLKNRYEKSVSTMVIITILSIFIGSFSLALITAIMNGFEKTVHVKLQNIHPQATIYSSGLPLSMRAIRSLLKEEFPEVFGMSPHMIGHVILPNQHDEDDHIPTVALLKGVNPKQEAIVSALRDKLISPTSLSSSIHGSHVLIGKTIAEQYGVHVGDPLPLIYLEQTERNNQIAAHREQAVVGGIFDTGIDEFDANLIVCSHHFFETLFPDQGITQIGLAFAPNSNIPEIVARLKQRLMLDVCSWQDLYPALVSALALEKYAMFFILLLITLVAAMNIISLIALFITQKQADIAILRAMGMPAQTVRTIFMLMGIAIATVSAVAGILCACIASMLLERYPFITLPHVYYVSHLPAHMEWSIVLVVLGVVLLITILATWLASQRAKSITIARVLRFEG